MQPPNPLCQAAFASPCSWAPATAGMDAKPARTWLMRRLMSHSKKMLRSSKLQLQSFSTLRVQKKLRGHKAIIGSYHLGKYRRSHESELISNRPLLSQWPCCLQFPPKKERPKAQTTTTVPQISTVQADAGCESCADVASIQIQATKIFA